MNVTPGRKSCNPEKREATVKDAHRTHGRMNGANNHRAPDIASSKQKLKRCPRRERRDKRGRKHTLPGNGQAYETTGQ